MRLIDADAVVKSILRTATEKPWHRTWADNDVENLIESQPTVDAVPVVRCKDCKYCERYNDSDIYYCTYFENNYMHIPKPDYGYCSRGERKDDDKR